MFMPRPIEPLVLTLPHGGELVLFCPVLQVLDLPSGGSEVCICVSADTVERHVVTERAAQVLALIRERRQRMEERAEARAAGILAGGPFNTN